MEVVAFLLGLIFGLFQKLADEVGDKHKWIYSQFSILLGLLEGISLVASYFLFEYYRPYALALLTYWLIMKKIDTLTHAVGFLYIIMTILWLQIISLPNVTFALIILSAFLFMRFIIINLNKKQIPTVSIFIVGSLVYGALINDRFSPIIVCGNLISVAIYKHYKYKRSITYPLAPLTHT